MTFHHGDTVRRVDNITYPLGRLGIVTLHTEDDDTYEVLWDETFSHTWETPEALTLVKRLPIV